MWLLTLVLFADTAHAFSVVLTPVESVQVTVTGAGEPVVLIPGLFGSAFGFRRVLPLLAQTGFHAVVVEPLGVGTSARPARADYSLTAQADGVAAGAARDLDGTLRGYVAMAAAREPERLAPHLAEIRCPVRLVIGTAPHQSGVSAAEVSALARALASFVIDSVAGAGHFLFEEQPAAVIAAVERIRSLGQWR